MLMSCSAEGPPKTTVARYGELITVLQPSQLRGPASDSPRSRVVVGQVVLVQDHVAGRGAVAITCRAASSRLPNTWVRLASPGPQRRPVGAADDARAACPRRPWRPGRSRRCAAPARAPSSTIPGVIVHDRRRPRRRVDLALRQRLRGALGVGVVGVVDHRDARVERRGLGAVRRGRHARRAGRGSSAPVRRRASASADGDGDVDRVARPRPAARRGAPRRPATSSPAVTVAAHDDVGARAVGRRSTRMTRLVAAVASAAIAASSGTSTFSTTVLAGSRISDLARTIVARSFIRSRCASPIVVIAETSGGNSRHSSRDLAGPVGAHLGDEHVGAGRRAGR